MHPERTSADLFLQVLLECKESARGLAGNQWTIGSDKSVTIEQFWTWSKVDGHDTAGGPISGAERCSYFEKSSGLSWEK